MRETKSSTPKEQGFYNKAVWKKARQMALNRDKHLCQHCLKRKRVTAATTVHHIKPTDTHPQLSLVLSNLESLCFDCHEATKQRGRPAPAIPDGVRVIKM